MRGGVATLLDKHFAGELAGRIDRGRRVPLPSARSLADSHTVYVAVVDRDRMAVSLINTLYSHFGVGICTEKTGIMLTNRGACFGVDPDHPNAFSPSKRPMHTIIPALAFRGGLFHASVRVKDGHSPPLGDPPSGTNIV